MTGLVQRFGRNLRGRDIAVGDIHGCFGKLMVALDEIDFNRAKDRLFSVGDLVDRGPDSEVALTWLDNDWFHAVRGNHEDLVIDAAAGDVAAILMHVGNGGDWFTQVEERTRQAMAEAFKKLPIAIEVDTPQGMVGIVHAECPTHTWPEMIAGLESDGADEVEYISQACMWARNRYAFAIAQGKSYPVGGVHAVINGHTVIKTPVWLSNSLFIDTGACYQGRFTLIDLATLSEATRPMKPPRDLSPLVPDSATLLAQIGC